MKTDPTTKILLGVIATGVAALTAIAFERRYCNGGTFKPADDLKDAASDTYQKISRNVEQAGTDVSEQAASLKERVEDGVDTLKDKAGSLKERISDRLERVCSAVGRVGVSLPFCALRGPGGGGGSPIGPGLGRVSRLATSADGDGSHRPAGTGNQHGAGAGAVWTKCRGV